MEEIEEEEQVQQREEEQLHEDVAVDTNDAKDKTTPQENNIEDVSEQEKGLSEQIKKDNVILRDAEIQTDDVIIDVFFANTSLSFCSFYFILIFLLKLVDV